MNTAPYWTPLGGRRTAPNPSGDWTSVGATSRYQASVCLQMVGMHFVQTHLRTVVVTDDDSADNTIMNLPDGSKAFAEAISLDTGEQRPLRNMRNSFCSSGQILSNGTFVTFGGHPAGDNREGRQAIQSYSPCNDDTCKFDLVGQMTSRRWYPTTQMLADGKILIVGGTTVTADLNPPGGNVPSVEYFPRAPTDPVYPMKLLVDSLPFNLYPIVVLLPSGKLWILAHNRHVLFDTTTNKEIPGTSGILDKNDTMNAPFGRTHPLTASHALLPLSSASGYFAEVLVCGGGTARAAKGGGYGAGDKSAGADHMCYLIAPESPSPTWEPYPMCADAGCVIKLRRVMGDAVLLADGNVLILNGAESGMAGWENARGPALAPLLFQTATKTWYRERPLAKSNIPRGYHSGAILLHTGAVMVLGSNPYGDAKLSIADGNVIPSSYRSEIFYPPYFYTGRAQPELTSVPASMTVSQQYTVLFSAPDRSGAPDPSVRFSFALIYAGVSTHGNRHGMRYVKLDVVSLLALGGGRYSATLSSPPNFNIAPPATYWLHMLDEGVPGKEGKPVFFVL